MGNAIEDMKLISKYLERIEGLECEVLWSAFRCALDENFHVEMEKRGEKVDIDLCFTCACQSWDV